MKKRIFCLIACVAALLCVLCACDTPVTEPESQTSELTAGHAADEFDPESLPLYNGEPYVALGDNTPVFDSLEKESFEYYSPLDELGRCGTVKACIGIELMPTEDRGSIGSVKPSGWQTVKYDFVDGKYLYNRCHLIGFQLSGENANDKNLITGTRSMNVDGMLPFENLVADYVKETKNHVMYRVTPVFTGNELVARGVRMEAFSVEDNGRGVCFDVYVFNVEPGVEINYLTGESALASQSPAPSSGSASQEEKQSYILNTSSKKIHLEGCSSVKSMSESNRQSFTGTLSELYSMGYEPCGSCKPEK